VSAAEAGKDQAELERRYRRLLWAYPRSYRHAHGDDLLTTLMDAAEPGRSRPTRADVVDLARGALRQRFRLPLGVYPVVAALLAALILGAIGAASGSWLAWQTAADLPSNAAARQIGATVLGTPRTATTVSRNDGQREIWRSVSVFYDLERFDWTLASAQARLQAGGWTPGRVQQSDAGLVAGYVDDDPAGDVTPTPLDGINQTFGADRPHQVLRGSALTITTPGHENVLIQVSIFPREPALVSVAVVVGWCGGAMLGWLLTAWATYRLRSRWLPARLAALILGLSAIALAAHPTIGLYASLSQRVFSRIDTIDTAPAYRWVVTSPAAGLVLGALLAGTGVLILAAAGRRDISRTATVA
jgi:hypothetical protein